MVLSICTNPEVLSVMKYVKIVIDIIRIVVPIALIIALMVSFARAVAGKGDDELSNSLKSSVNKILAAVIVFLIPTFVNVIIATLDAKSIDFASCLNNATDENIRIAYNKQAETYVAIANESLLRADYNAAISKVNRLKDAEEQKKLQAQLEEIKEKVEDREKQDSIIMGGYVGDGFMYPLGDYRGITTCCFGSVESLHPSGHSGLDIAAPAGTPIYAAKAGVVSSSSDGMTYGSGDGYFPGMTSCGNYVIIDHQDGTETWYCHMSYNSVKVTTGQTVAQGQQIGAVGSTGHSTGNHLHLTIKKDGVYLNPAKQLIYNAVDGAGCGIRTQ